MAYIKHTAIHTTPMKHLKYILNPGKNEDMKYSTAICCTNDYAAACEDFKEIYEADQADGGAHKYDDYKDYTEITDFEDEVEKMLEKLCISDYFYDIPYDEIWKMGVKTIVSKIKFKDLEHVLTILSSEASEAPIFCTKTFLSLKKSLEDAKLVERLWIEHDRSHGRLKLSYDATKDEYLEMRILSNIRFTEGDLLTAKEIYDSYAGDAVGKVKRGDQRCAV